jgi:hypothetical protein
MTGKPSSNLDTSRVDVWLKKQSENAAGASNEPELPLHGGGGNGPMEPNISIKDYVDAKDEAIETRLESKLDKLATKGTIWTAVATGIGILAALVAYGGDRFDGGVSVSPTISKMQTEQTIRDADQDAQLKLMDQKLDILIKQTSSN